MNKEIRYRLSPEQYKIAILEYCQAMDKQANCPGNLTVYTNSDVSSEISISKDANEVITECVVTITFLKSVAKN